MNSTSKERNVRYLNSNDTFFTKGYIGISNTVMREQQKKGMSDILNLMIYSTHFYQRLYWNQLYGYLREIKLRLLNKFVCLLINVIN